MSHLHRFYAPELPEEPGRVSLSEDEAHHAVKVLRVRAGDRVTVFDGAGRFADGTVGEVGKRDVWVELGPVQSDPEPGPRVTLIQAWLNHERNVESIIRRGTELGVAEFVFFRGDHSERPPKPREKWLKHAIDSCKQCGRNRLPEFRTAEGLAEALNPVSDRVLVATQAVDGRPIAAAVEGAHSVALIIGPEGDLSASEVEAAMRGGAAPISLGPYTLRSEVAATVAIALVQYSLGALR